MTAAPVAYLIHFSEPYKHVRHYLGFAPRGLAARVREHERGNGARLIEVITAAGIGWQVVRTWPDPDGGVERRLKDSHNSPDLCPRCSPGNRRALDPAPKAARRARSAGWMASPKHRTKPRQP